MKAYVFPGQGAQFPGMGKEIYEGSKKAKKMFETANDILGFKITDIMFNGTADELKQTNVTQPAVFLHSVILASTLGEDVKPEMVAGHSLGELSALVINKTIAFEDALLLVSKRAIAMQKACEINPSTMAAVLKLDTSIIEKICGEITNNGDIVVPANYNSPGQLVISGTNEGIDIACVQLKESGAKRALKLPVGGAFHSPLMEPAAVELAAAIKATKFKQPICPVYQNVNAEAVSNPDIIKSNLISQLTAPVKWSQTIEQMIADGATSFTEIGPGKVLAGLVKQINNTVETFNHS
jgi:[acyl-carrier-protein] S-malonyltransferase